MNVQHSRSPHGADCESCPHHHVDVMGATPAREREALLPFFRLRQFAPHETLHAEGASGAHVAMVRSGLVKLVRYSASGDERIVRLAMPGDTIGLELMLDRHHHHTAIAISAVEVCLMPLHLVEERATHSSEFAKTLMAEWHASVDAAERFLTELSTGSAQQRVARLLLYLQDRVHGDECPHVTHDDMSALLGITAETTSRIVAAFKRDGWLVEDAQGRWRCDRAALQAIAEG
jgi:CRP-like cAMP-binding protein